MNSIPLPLVDGDTLLLDNSSLEKLTTCPRSAQYAICSRLQGASDRVALRFGGIAHKVLEARYRACSPLYAQSPAVEKVMVAIAADEFTKWQPPEDDYRNYDRMVDLIVNYGITYPMEQFELVTLSDGKPAIEIPFAYPLGIIDGVKVMWIGKIDMAYTYNGQLFLMDHKTSSMATNMDEFLISHQFYGYAWALEQLLGRQVDGTIINRIVCRKPTKTGIPFTFERKYIPIGRQLLQDWKQDCLHIIADFMESARRGYFPKHTAHCVSKYGTCEFHKACTLDNPAERDVMLNSGEFNLRTWSPLKETQ